MSKNWLSVLNGVTRRVKKAYSVVEGVTREIKKGYTVQEGVTRQFYSGAAAITYTGTYTIADITKDGVAYKLYTLTGSGTLTTAVDGIQYWMCAGGGGGGRCSTSGSNPYNYASGGGGGGGYVDSGTLSAGEHVITIGAGGAAANMLGNSAVPSVGRGGTTKVGSHSVSGGDGAWRKYHTSNPETGGDGQSGGGGGIYRDDVASTGYPVKAGAAGAGAGGSTYPFGLMELYAHSAGGGGSNYYTPYNTSWSGGAGGSNGSSGAKAYDTGSNDESAVGKGGDRGGGDGDGRNASFYGSGGGGRGGKGYQGVCYLLVPAELLAA